MSCNDQPKAICEHKRKANEDIAQDVTSQNEVITVKPFITEHIAERVSSHRHYT